MYNKKRSSPCRLQQLYSEAVLILSDLLEEDLIEMEQKALRERKIKMRA